MPVWLGILVASMADRMQEAEQRKQAAADMQMQFARSLDPQVPTYGYQAAKFNSQQAANGGQSVARMLPMLLAQKGTAEPDNWGAGGDDFTQDPDWYQRQVNAASGSRNGLRMTPWGGRI